MNLSELQARSLARLDWRTIFRFTDKESGEPTSLNARDADALDGYFARFLPPGPCVGCGAVLVRDEIASFLLGASFTWGITNGEGHCRECGYPARAYHRDIGPIKFLSAVLQWHPDELVKSGDQKVVA